MTDCIFCRIINKEIPAAIVYEDDEFLAFEDIHPLAPVHILIIPKTHWETVEDVPEENSAVFSHLFAVAKKIAAEKNLTAKGYRLVNNCREEAGQTVFHLHFHLLGGGQLGGFGL